MQSRNGSLRLVTGLIAASTVLGGAAVARSQEGAHPAAAAAPLLSELDVALWPEYDRPAVLVMYRAHLPGDARLPAVVTLPMPAAAGEPHAVARRGGDGGLYVAPYTRTVKGEWAAVAVTTDSPDVQMEYYLPLSTGTARRRFVFTWPGGPAISTLVVQVQKPATASDPKLDPPATDSSVQGDGLTYYRVRLGSVPAQGRASLTVAYTKADAALTAPPGQAQAAAPEAAENPAMPPAGMPGAGAEPPPGSPAVAAPARSEPASRDPVLWIVVAGIAVVFFVAGFLVSRGGRAKKP